ncbi:MAG: glycosyltransferase family 2 protein, partial [Euryarchaeota archaeon]|nr:glycosyltransferase family 2 protein [Euryarchaeota archaeon]
MDNPEVAVVIINWNGWEDTIECLESLYQIDYPNYNVILVDNASEDDSMEKIKEYCAGKLEIQSDFFDYDKHNKPLNLVEGNFIPDDFSHESKNLFLIQNQENYGFAEGNNIGIRFSLKQLNPEYMLLLNNDTVVDKYFLKELVNLGQSDEKIGIVGPKIYYYDEPQTIWCIGGKISWKLARGIHIGNNEVDEGQYENIEEVEYVSGSAFLIKKEVLEKAGLMDKDFFLYFEETDLTLRSSKLGYKSFYNPKAKVWHKVSKSGGGMSKPIGLYYITRNRWLFMKRWAKKSDFIFFIISQIIGAFFLPVYLIIVY